MPSLPYLTADLPGIGGVLKEQPEDFIVEEIPGYEPCGKGEHLFLWVEKRDLSAEQMTQQIAKALRIPMRDVGAAGLKDRRAVTRQFVSVPARSAERIEAIDSDSMTVLHSARHTNKLRTGHLRGNRFSILVRETVSDALQRAGPIEEKINGFGFPNYYGEQRFGREGETLVLGFDLLRGAKTTREIPASRRRSLLRLALSAVQSFLFNQALAQRLAEGTLQRVLSGDVMQVRESGGLFVAEDVPREQARYEAGETAVTGPMFGVKMKLPAGEVLERETRLLAENRLSPEDFRAFRKMLPGTRRAYVVRPEGLAFEAHPEGLRFSFTLPAGAYATVLLREFIEPVED